MVPVDGETVLLPNSEWKRRKGGEDRDELEHVWLVDSPAQKPKWPLDIEVRSSREVLWPGERFTSHRRIQVKFKATT